MQQHHTVLVVAQHGRFLAQLAHRAGHRVLVADCFGDQDTLAIATRWQPLGNLQDTVTIRNTLLTLSQNESCLLVYGSGVEAFFPIIATLPDSIKVLGNTADIIANVKTPVVFFSTLQKLNIPYPQTEFTPPNSNTQKWLCKPNMSFGGEYITDYDHRSPLTDCYYQQYIEGRTGSVLFLADGEEVQLYLISQQFQYHSTESPFLLSGLSTPLILSGALQEILTTFITQLVSETGLCGFNSLDFIVTPDDALYILEINPRISASVALLSTSIDIFERQLSACLRRSLLPPPVSINQTHLHTFFAPSDLTVPEFIDWPATYHDLPHPKTGIKKGRPICSAVIETSMSFEQSAATEQQALLSLLGLLENSN